MAGFQDWLKKNTVGNAKFLYGGGIGLGFLGLDVANIAASDNKLKELLKTLGRLVLIRPLIAVGLAGAFTAMSKSVRSLVNDTGSLEAYLRKLTQIQGLQRMFAPLVGGAEAAKRKVAELVNIAASSPFKKLGDWGEAARGLAIFTRGAYSGATALKTVGDAAAATGNGLVQTSDAIGEFYATLRAGEPIANAAEKLRQMGVINDATAASLGSLQESGAGAARVFDELTGALGQHSGAMDALKGDLASIQDEYDSAATTLKEKFASPFAADDVQNTKNMADAMIAIAPTVEHVAGWLAKLTGGFQTVNSWVAKTAAQSPILRGALELVVKTVTGLIAVVSVVAGVQLGGWLIGVAAFATQAAAALSLFVGASGAAATVIAALGVAVRVAAIATGVGVIVVALATAIGIIYNFVQAADGQTKAVEALRKAHEQADSAMKRQIASVTTLAERHEALTRALQEQTDAQMALNDAIKGKKAPEEIAELQKRVIGAIKNVRQATSTPAEGLAPSPEEQRRIQMEAERSRGLSDQAFANEMQTATPGRRRELLSAKQADLQARAEAAAGGVNASAEASRAKADAMLAVAQAAASQPHTTSGIANDALISAWRTEANIGLAAPKDSSLFAETMAQKLMAARRLLAGGLNQHEEDRMTAIAGRVTNTLQPGEQIEPAIANWLRYAAQRKQDEGNAAQLATQASEVGGQIAAMDRETQLTEERARIEKEIAELKSHGVERAEAEYRLRQKLLSDELAAERAKKSPDAAKVNELEAEKAALQRQATERHRAEEVEKASVQRQITGGLARRTGTDAGAGESVLLSNLDSFARKFEQLRDTVGDEEARKQALALTQNEIEDRAGGVIASSLARIGGGGGVYDPSHDVQVQMRDLISQSVDYLQSIDEHVAADDSTANAPDTSRPE